MTNNAIAKAFIEAQKEMVNAIKDSNNPYYKSKYADLNSVREACIPSLNKFNIAVLQPTISIDGKNYVKTILLHESGETIESLTEILFSKQGDPQAQGSGITYARRYGLQSLVCIGAEDDDGNVASGLPNKEIKTISVEQGVEIEELLKLINISNLDFCKVYKIDSIINLPASKFQEAKTRLQNKSKELKNNKEENANN